MARPVESSDVKDLDHYVRLRNAACSSRLLESLRVHHAPCEIPEPEPEVVLPPIPNRIMAEACEIAAGIKPMIVPGKVRAIQVAVLREFPDVTLRDLFARRRTRAVVHPRQVAMYLAKILTGNSLPEIGRRFGGRDHTTVLHSVRKIAQDILTKPELAAQIERLKLAIGGGPL